MLEKQNYLKSAMNQKHKTGDHRESNANHCFACMLLRIMWNITFFIHISYNNHTIYQNQVALTLDS